MLTQLREEEQQYIDDILSNGLEEIMDIPSFEASTISNVTIPIQNNDYLTYSISSGNNNNLREGSRNLNNVHLNFDYGTNNISNTSQDNNMYLNLSKNSKKIEFNNDYRNTNPFDNKQKTENNSVIVPETPTLNCYNCESRKNEIFLNNNTNNVKFDKYKSTQDDKYKISELNNNDIKNVLNNSALSNEHNIINNEKNNFNDEKQKYSTFNFKNINLNLNEDLPLKIENEKINDSFLVLPMNIPNNREIIQSALLNNQKNLNKLNKQISGETLGNSTNNNSKNDVDLYELSISTKKLIDKYIDLQISTYSKKDTFTSNNNNNNNNFKNEKIELNQIIENNKKDNNNLKESQSNLLLNENSSFNDMTSSLLGKNSKNSFLMTSNMEQNNISDINNSEIMKVNELSELNHNNNKDKIDIKKIEQPIKNVKIDKLQKLNDDKDIKKKEKKYKPRSSALKKLINKLKKEDELYDNNCIDSYKYTKKSTNDVTGKRNININSNNNNSSINSFQINESELFTLGNSNISLSTLNSKKPKKIKVKEKEKEKYNMDSSRTFRKNKKYKKPNSSVEFKYDKKFYPRTGITTAKSKDKNLKKFEKILSSKKRYDILKEEMDSIQAQINNISERINLGDSSKRDKYMKKTYSAKLIKMNPKNNKYLNISSFSSLKLDDASYRKKKKSRPLSVNCSYDSNKSNKSGQKTKKSKEEKIYKNKYQELREKFDLQRDKMKSEKQNIISLQQKIKILEKKHEKYPELVEYNNTLNEQNIMLKNNLNILDDVRKKQSLLIEALKNEIYRIKNKGNFLNKNDNDNDNENEYYNDSNNFINESEEIQSDHLEN